MKDLPAPRSRTAQHLAKVQQRLQAVLSPDELAVLNRVKTGDESVAETEVKELNLLEAMGDDRVLMLVATGAGEDHLCRYLGISSGTIAVWASSTPERQDRYMTVRASYMNDKAFSTMINTMNLPDSITSGQGRAAKLKLQAASTLIKSAKPSAKPKSGDENTGSVYHLTMFGGQPLPSVRQGVTVEGDYTESETPDR